MRQYLMTISLVISINAPSMAFSCSTTTKSNDAQRWSELNLAGQKANAEGDSTKARALFEQARTEAEAKHLDVERAATLNDLGMLYRSGKDYKKAESALREAASIRELQLGRDAECTGVTLNNLAELYFDEGRFDLAETTYKSALISTEAPGSDALHAANVLNNLGALYNSRGRFTDAEPYLVRALEEYRKVRSNDNADDQGTRIIRALAEANGDAPERLEDVHIRDLTEALMRGYLENRRYAEFRKLYVQFQKSKKTPEGAAHAARVFAKKAEEFAEEGRRDDAEAMFNRALGAYEAAGELESADAAATQARYAAFQERRKDKAAHH